jgi:hypothetical protein
MLLQQIFRHRKEAEALAAVDAVSAAIAALPEEADLVHVSYLAFSWTDTRSRSWLLSTLPGLRGALTLARSSLTPAELANRGFEGMYDKTTKAYEAWRALAQPRLRVPQAALRVREEGPRARGAGGEGGEGRAVLLGGERKMQDRGAVGVRGEWVIDMGAMRGLLREWGELARVSEASEVCEASEVRGGREW